MVFLAAVTLIGIPLCRNKTGKVVYCTIAGIALFVLAAIRKYTGYDYNLYARVYVDYLSMSVEDIGYDRFEKGIAMPMKLLGDVLYRDYQWNFVIYALIFAAALMILLYKTTDKPYIGVFFFLTLGVYFITFDFMRQMVASFVIVLGMRFIKNKQFFRYLIIVLFASCFHLSALVMIPFYFILRIRLNYIWLGVYTGIGAFIFIFSWDVIRFLTSFIPKYNTYAKGEIAPETGEMSGSIWSPLFTILVGVLFVIAFLFRERLQKKDPFNTILINCMAFTFFFDLLSYKHNIIGRLELPFLLMAASVLMPRLVECTAEWFRIKFRGDKKKVTILSAISLTSLFAVCVGMYGFMIESDFNGVKRYQTIWDNTPWVNPREEWEKSQK